MVDCTMEAEASSPMCMTSHLADACLKVFGYFSMTLGLCFQRIEK